MSLSRPLRPSLSSPYPPPILTPSHHPRTQTQTRHQVRHATLLRRPLRPYTFTQLVSLSDGSTYTHRTTSPAPVYISSKDVRNSPMWNPSSQKLLNVEADEAGKLKRFREKFGRGWDANAAVGGGAGGSKGAEGGKGGKGEGVVEGTIGGEEVQETNEKEDNLMDLISGYGQAAEAEGNAAGVNKSKTRSGKGKGGER